MNNVIIVCYSLLSLLMIIATDPQNSHFVADVNDAMTMTLTTQTKTATIITIYELSCVSNGKTCV